MTPFYLSKKGKQSNRKMGKVHEQIIHRKGNLKSNQEHANWNNESLFYICQIGQKKKGISQTADVSQDTETCTEWNIADGCKITIEHTLAAPATGEHMDTKENSGSALDVQPGNPLKQAKRK